MQSPRSWLVAFGFAIACLPFVHAQTPVAAWPGKPIKMIINFPPGGATDAIGRTVANRLSEALGQPVVVENRVGVAGNVGMEAVARATPDGYTLLHSSDGPILINPHILKMETDVARDLVPVAPTAGSQMFLIARPDIPVRNVQEFIAYARANLGKLNYGSAGNGSLQHVAIEMLLSNAKLQAVHVPYKGSQAILADMLGGRIDFTMDVGASIPHIKAGKIRLLAVPGKTRSTVFPDAPTLNEAGVNMELTWISGVYAPAGTPAPVVARLNREIARIMQLPETRNQLDAMAAEALPAMTPEAFAAHQQRARDSFGATVRDAGIKAD